MKKRRETKNKFDSKKKNRSNLLVIDYTFHSIGISQYIHIYVEIWFRIFRNLNEGKCAIMMDIGQERI